MSPAESSASSQPDFLAGTFQRILRNTIALSIAAILAASAFFGWRGALGTASGAVTAYASLRWLHYGTEQMVRRILAAGKYSSARVLSAFLGRLALVSAIAYVIFVSSRLAFYCFVASLFLPIAGAIGEAIYEALNTRTNKTPKGYTS